MDMTLNEIKDLTNTCWDKKHQSIANDMAEDEHTGRIEWD